MIYDISRTLAAGIAVWPGDAPFESAWTKRIADGDAVNLGRIAMSIHTGTHVDAPYHFLEDGRKLHEVPLTVWMGEAIVVDATHAETITMNDVPEEAPPRILFRTRHSENLDDTWNPRFPSVDPEIASLLASKGVALLGTDAPSVDPFGDETLPAHHALARHGILILENLRLSDVRPGRYELVALPLKLDGMDGSPVRAVLVGA